MQIVARGDAELAARIEPVGRLQQGHRVLAALRVEAQPEPALVWGEVDAHVYLHAGLTRRIP